MARDYLDAKVAEDLVKQAVAERAKNRRIEAEIERVGKAKGEAKIRTAKTKAQTAKKQGNG